MLSSAVASTLLAGLELAREGQITLAQDEGFGAITVHGAPGVAAAGVIPDALTVDSDVILL